MAGLVRGISKEWGLVRPLSVQLEALAVPGKADHVNIRQNPLRSLTLSRAAIHSTELTISLDLEGRTLDWSAWLFDGEI